MDINWYDGTGKAKNVGCLTDAIVACEARKIECLVDVPLVERIGRDEVVFKDESYVPMPSLLDAQDIRLALRAADEYLGGR